MITSKKEAWTEAFTPSARSLSIRSKRSVTARGMMPASSGEPFTCRIFLFVVE